MQSTQYSSLRQWLPLSSSPSNSSPPPPLWSLGFLWGKPCSIFPFCLLYKGSLQQSRSLSKGHRVPRMIRFSENRVIRRDSGFRRYEQCLFSEAEGTSGRWFTSENRKYLPWLACEFRLHSVVGVRTSVRWGTLEGWGWQRGLWTRGATDLRGLEVPAARGGTGGSRETVCVHGNKTKTKGTEQMSDITIYLMCCCQDKSDKIHKRP